MAQYIDKDALVAEIDKGINWRNDWQLDEYRKGYHDALTMLKKYLSSLEVKEVDLDCNSWIPFMPSSDLPKDRVTVAYKTNDERGIRYAYGHFQFRNGNCSMFWKDSNELPTTIKNEDIVCWMPVNEVKAQKG